MKRLYENASVYRFQHVNAKKKGAFFKWESGIQIIEWLFFIFNRSLTHI